MEEMRRIAYETVLRACGFASLAIFCIMIGLSFLPRSAFQAGGFLSMAMTLVLILKAREARTKDHRRTEMWLYLPKESRPPQALAQKMISTIMRETYFSFARWTAIVSIARTCSEARNYASNWRNAHLREYKRGANPKCLLLLSHPARPPA
jgi:hypothetical protein